MKKSKLKGEWVDFKPEEKVLIKLLGLAIRKRDQAEGTVNFLEQQLRDVRVLIEVTELDEKPKKQGKKK